MEFFAAVCPQCSGNLQLPDDRDTVKCMYCGADIVIKEQKSNDINIANILEIARTALSGGNYQEAHTQYNKILESDTNNIEAWIGKGKSSAHLSTLAIYRGDEMLECFKKAIKISQPTEEYNSTKMLCAIQAFEFAVAYEGLSTRHAIQFMGVHSARYEHWDRCKKIIELCAFSKENDPDLETINSFVQDLCKRNLKVSMMLPDDKKYFTAQIEKFSDLPRIDFTKKKEASKPMPTASLVILLTILLGIGITLGYYSLDSSGFIKFFLMIGSILFLTFPGIFIYILLHAVRLKISNKNTQKK